MKQRWLFVSHEASNSGAPRMLLEVMRGLQRHAGESWSCETLLARRGARSAGSVAEEFARFGRVRVLLSAWAENGSKAARAFDRWLLQRRRLARWRAEWATDTPDVIYANTAANGRILAGLRALPCPVITHVHELDYSLRRFTRPRELAAVWRCTDRFFAVSQAVIDDLVARGVARERIDRVPNFLLDLPAVPEVEAAKAEVRRRLGLPEGVQLVTGCGHIDPVKGTDRFVEMAAACSANATRPLAFVWIGGEADAQFAERLRAEVRTRGLADRVRFVGAVPDAGIFFAASEVVTVTSRVESFSRVALEAGALGQPVLAYAEARGPADLLTADQLVSEASGGAMAEAVSTLLAAPEKAREQGMALRRRIAAEFLAEKWIGEIRSVVQRLRRG